MSGQEDLVSMIKESMPNIKQGTLVVFGDIFGGRIDNIHRVIDASADGEGTVTVYFDQGETLIIWDLRGVTVSSFEFRVDRASRVRWDWYFYGREHVPDNRFFIEHRVVGNRVEVASNVNWYRPSYAPSLLNPAVQLVA